MPLKICRDFRQPVLTSGKYYVKMTTNISQWKMGVV